MKYQIIGKNITVTDAIRSAIETKLNRLEKFFVINDDVTCRAVVRSYKAGAKVEITIFTNVMNVRAEVHHDDLYAAIDLSVDKLESQLVKLKARIKNYAQPSLGKSINLESIAKETTSNKFEEIVRTKSIDLVPMTIEEAVTRMEALGHSFFLYFDIEDKKVGVVYRRLDQGFGLIQVDNKVQ
jgi:putative sigma-54 modulation protein